MRLSVPRLCSHHFLLDERILWPWNPGLLLFHWGHVNTCIFLIWVPNLCLQAFLFSVLKFPTWPPIFHRPCLFLFLALSLFPPSQFCSSALMEGDVWRASLRSCTRSESGGGAPGRRRNAILRNICQARRLDEGCSSKAQQEAFVEKGENNPETTAYWHLSCKVSRLCDANVRALNLHWNMDLVFNYLGQKWFYKIQIELRNTAT